MKTRSKILVSLMVVMMSFINVNKTYAQFFIMEDEYNKNRSNTTVFDFPGIMPDHDTTWDYTPIGNGIWLLGCLGGAYLLGKRRKSKTDLPD